MTRTGWKTIVVTKWVKNIDFDPHNCGYKMEKKLYFDPN
jgi:hypothetical protein